MCGEVVRVLLSVSDQMGRVYIGLMRVRCRSLLCPCWCVRGANSAVFHRKDFVRWLVGGAGYSACYIRRRHVVYVSDLNHITVCCDLFGVEYVAGCGQKVVYNEVRIWVIRGFNHGVQIHI